MSVQLYSKLIVIMLTSTIELPSSVLSQFPYEFRSSREPVRDINGLKQVLKRKNDNPASYLLTPGVIQKYGYPVEKHPVMTADGYILTMHRIPYGKNYVAAKRKPVVFLQHGLFASSFEWFMNTPDKLLALQLADAGYDVWLGNARGNAYSRLHKNMTVTDRKYWEFSMHEMGKYDIPAEIDHVLKTTGEPKVYYIGFSMGTSMYWIMMSLHPEYNEKVRLMTALAPVVYINNMVGFPRFIAPFERYLKVVLDFIGNGEFLPPWLLNLYNTIGTKLCSNLIIAESFCANINFLYAGWDLPQSQINQIPLFYSHTPSPTSTRTLTHIAQFINTGIFQQYDFGSSANLLIYGTAKPPKYTLRNTTAPVALLWGPNDAVVNPIDVARLASELPNVVLNTPIDFSLWNHFDYHLAKDANELVNKRVLQLLPKF